MCKEVWRRASDSMVTGSEGGGGGGK
jgi:hypothetical protein